MDRQQTLQILAYINRATNQTITDGSGQVWHDLIGHLAQDTALEAARDALSDVDRAGRWITPSDVLAAADRRRRARAVPVSAVAALPGPTYLRLKDVPGINELVPNAGRFTEPWRDTPCPHCGAQPQAPCVNTATDRPTNPHPSRMDAAKEHTP
jgi:hypothetical protein